MDYAVETRGLVKKFRSFRGVRGMLQGKGAVRETVAVDGLNLEVPTGSVYGLLGRNGAGKTTTIQLLVGLLEPTAGEVSVLGLDPLRNHTELMRYVGHVADGQQMYDFMTVEGICQWTSTFYPVTWNKDLQEDLLDRFDLPRDAPLRDLSRGMKAQVALTLALAHEPELLLMDESTSGLDAVVRRQFLETIAELSHERERTAVLSSHIIDDMERVCDWVGILHRGKLIVQEPLESLKASVKQLHLRYRHAPPGELPGFAGRVLQMKWGARDLVITLEGYTEEVGQALRAHGALAVEVIDLSLEEIFVAYTSTPPRVRRQQPTLQLVDGEWGEEVA